MMRYFKIAYSESGIWSSQEFTFGDKILSWLPVLNTLGIIVFHIMDNPKRK